MTKIQKSKSKQKNGRPYPRVALEKALKIAQAIKEKNGGNAWPPEQVAAAVGVSSRTPGFFYQTSAAQAFGLTKGTRDASKIELDSLGHAIVYAGNAEDEVRNKQKAFFNIDIFKKVFEHYGGSSLPETKYLSNTLENEFNLSPEFHDEFIQLFKDNCKFLGLESAGNLPPDSEVGSLVMKEKSVDSETIILSESKGKNPQVAFVIMPFSERTDKYAKGFFTEVLNSLVTPAAADAGFTVQTAKRTGSDVIQSTIINALIEADLAIADLTEHNPNVLFELGLRMALQKPVLLIRAKGTDKIFDVDNMLRVFDYNPNLWTTTLTEDLPELTKHIKSAWESRMEKTYMQLLQGNVIKK